ncbi:alpha/beta hydrolase [Streptomyces sp. DK15]|uniref:alpha/beta fold hydrolase n=1 Tax=Streptomyces sp. DK15 TaxID=2957499 RepID=UPI0029B567C0|nr:alpha/beta hydrolase [Streptomyces sp. DK15]MDX2389084.1 alpha/beta hydrolase [Streptomyces sp. DK15]
MSVRSRNHVRVSGRAGGSVLVLAHGFGCDQNMWHAVLPDLERDHTVVLFDHVGAGRSDLSAWSRERYSAMDGYVEDVLAICRETAAGPVVFVGHSVSAMMGVLAAAREPELFAGLVLLAPSPCFIDDPATGYRGGFDAPDIEELLDSLDANYLGWSGAMAPVIMGNPERPELGEELASSFCRTDPEIARVFARVTFLSDNREDLARVTVPTLVAQCSHDAIAPPEVGEFVRDRIPGSRLVTLTATGHCPQLSAPAETTAVINAFVRSLG